MTLKTYLKGLIDRSNLYDFLMIVVGIMLCCVASPYVVRQFVGLKNIGDIFWNVCWDILVFIIGLIALMLLAQILKAVSSWLKKLY